MLNDGKHLGCFQCLKLLKPSPLSLSTQAAVQANSQSMSVMWPGLYFEPAASAASDPAASAAAAAAAAQHLLVVKLAESLILMQNNTHVKNTVTYHIIHTLTGKHISNRR